MGCVADVVTASRLGPTGRRDGDPLHAGQIVNAPDHHPSRPTPNSSTPPDDAWWCTPDSQDRWSCENDARTSGKGKKYAPEFRQHATRVVIETGRSRAWLPRSVSVSSYSGVERGSRVKRQGPTVLPGCLMLMSAR